MKLSLGVTTSMPLRESLALAGQAEKAGYHRVWVGEDLRKGDVFACLSVLACRTNRIKLGTGVTSPWVRNLGVIANSAAGVQGLSGGRFILGLGVGGLPELVRITASEPRRVVARIREAVSLLRRIFKGEEVTHQGFSVLRGYSLVSVAPAPRIYLGVRGPRLLALAGEIADGVIISGPKRYLGEAVKIVVEAAAENGRDPGEVEKVLWNPPDALKPREGSSFPRAPERLCIHGSKREVLKSLEKYASMGFSEAVIGPPYGRDARRAVAAMGMRGCSTE